jgi:hypothetical protein
MWQNYNEKLNRSVLWTALKLDEYYNFNELFKSYVKGTAPSMISDIHNARNFNLRFIHWFFKDAKSTADVIYKGKGKR